MIIFRAPVDFEVLCNEVFVTCDRMFCYGGLGAVNICKNFFFKFPWIFIIVIIIILLLSFNKFTKYVVLF